MEQDLVIRLRSLQSSLEQSAAPLQEHGARRRRRCLCVPQPPLRSPSPAADARPSPAACTLPPAAESQQLGTSHSSQVGSLKSFGGGSSVAAGGLSMYQAKGKRLFGSSPDLAASMPVHMHRPSAPMFAAVGRRRVAPDADADKACHLVRVAPAACLCPHFSRRPCPWLDACRRRSSWLWRQLLLCWALLRGRCCCWGSAGPQHARFWSPRRADLCRPLPAPLASLLLSPSCRAPPCRSASP